MRTFINDWDRTDWNYSYLYFIILLPFSSVSSFYFVYPACRFLVVFSICLCTGLFLYKSHYLLVIYIISVDIILFSYFIRIYYSFAESWLSLSSSR